MKKHFTFITSLLALIFVTNISAQQETIEKWVPVKKEADIRIYLDVNGLEKVSGTDIKVWTREYYEPSRIIETINTRIDNAKINYLINTELKKYSILSIIYYDGANNIIKQFDYEHNSDITDYQYNYPILLDSDMDLIFEECVRYLWN